MKKLWKKIKYYLTNGCSFFYFNFIKKILNRFLDVFRNETPDTIQSVLGTASHMTSFTFNLTDNLSMSKFNINDNTSSTGYNLTTDNLVQLDKTDKTQIYLLPPDNDINPLLKESDFTNTNIVKWAIDMIDIKVIGKSNFKITFYSIPDNRNGAVNDNFSIWSGTYQTVGKASNNSRLIQNTFILANNTWMGYTLLDTNYIDKWTN